MAGHSRFTVLLDANVLYSVAICDALMSVAATGIYCAKWSSEIDAEWIRNLAADRNIPEQRLHVRRDSMHAACPDWEVEEQAWQSILPCIELPDSGDHHVLAAAVAGHADAIVTQNLRDFPADKLAPFGIDVIHPDAFLAYQLDLDPVRVLTAFKAMRARLKNPACTPEMFASSMERNGLVQVAGVLREAASLI